MSTIVMIPVHSIKILNPRSRNKKIFEELIESIRKVGLKRPITVRHAPNSEGYELICGQGRMEAFQKLGQVNIPAIIIEASRDECFIMSLVENLARRHVTPLELIREIGSLSARGYSNAEIATKTGFSTDYVCSINGLLEKGEERLLDAVERGIIPHTIAREIARATDGEVQKALTEAYESGLLPGKQVLAIRRIVGERNTIGKDIKSIRQHNKGKQATTATALVRAYQKEVDRQKILVKKAHITQGRLAFIISALGRLLTEDHFVQLLRAENLASLPHSIAERLGIGHD